jgi:hypothetical protein
MTLAHWKTEENAKIVLVLEANDIQLTAPDLVADTFVPLVKDIRMFGPRGNPQPRNLFSVIGCLQKQAGLELHVAG